MSKDIHIQRRKAEIMALRTELETNHAFGEIIGRSKKMQQLFTQIQTAAIGNITVLIQGETGTGKELVAKSIHDNSPRKAAPFVAINCTSIPEGLIESELFGHERGAFTGAIAQRIGQFEHANTGTLFLDEIGDMPPALQAKLLRVLEEREFQRVGSTSTMFMSSTSAATAAKREHSPRVSKKPLATSLSPWTLTSKTIQQRYRN